MTKDDYPSRRAVWLSLLCIAVVTGGAFVWTWWQRAPDARAAMSRGQYARAYDFYYEAAQKGDPAAQTALGNLYYLGMGTARDYQAAVHWYYAAAKQRHGPAQLNLGHLYQQGLGVRHDPVRAFGWYNMSSKTGNPDAEQYLRQVASEWTLSPLMISTAQTRWSRLDALLEEEL